VRVFSWFALVFSVDTAFKFDHNRLLQYPYSFIWWTYPLISLFSLQPFAVIWSSKLLAFNDKLFDCTKPYFDGTHLRSVYCYIHNDDVNLGFPVRGEKFFDLKRLSFVSISCLTARTQVMVHIYVSSIHGLPLSLHIHVLLLNFTAV
jgi:hypothetical protein